MRNLWGLWLGLSIVGCSAGFHHAVREHFYVVRVVTSGITGEIETYGMDSGGGLVRASRLSITAQPLATAVHPTLPIVYVATGSPGILAARIEAASGALAALDIGVSSLTKNPNRILFDRSGSLLFVAEADFGGSVLEVYRVDASGALSLLVSRAVDADSSYFSIVSSDDARELYFGRSGGIRHFSFDPASGALAEQALLGAEGQSYLEASSIHPQGGYLYSKVSNRIGFHRILEGGALSRLGTVAPVGAAVISLHWHPGEQLLLLQTLSTLEIYRMDLNSGDLRLMDLVSVANTRMAYDRWHQRAWVDGGGQITGFFLDSVTGTLTQGGPIASVSGYGIFIDVLKVFEAR
ncbi:MAG: hypothetical protein AB7F66_03655 [Bacteriovoracia bacterium]